MKNDINDSRFQGGAPSASYAFERDRLIHLDATPEEAHQAGLRNHLAVFEKKDGVGAPGYETGNHFAAILRYEGKDAHDRAVRKLFKENPAHARALGLVEPPRLGS